MYTIEDRLYGRVEVDSIIWELIQTDLFKRLKGIHQGGAIYLVDSRIDTTRYEHSIGTFILAKKLGATTLEQVASLLHDIAHRAFSHVVDYVLDTGEEDYHDKLHIDIIHSKEIVDILNRYKLTAKDILDCNYYALEAPLPELSIDRIDYSLRDLYSLTLIDTDEIEAFIFSLEYRDKLYLRDISWAKWFHQNYYRVVIDFYRKPMNIFANDTLTKILQLAMEKKYIKLEDFDILDKQLLAKVKSINNNEINYYLNILNKDTKVEVVEEGGEINRKFKVRIIDPHILDKGRVKWLSDIDKDIIEINKRASEIQAKELSINIDYS